MYIINNDCNNPGVHMFQSIFFDTDGAGVLVLVHLTKFIQPGEEEIFQKFIGEKLFRENVAINDINELVIKYFKSEYQDCEVLSVATRLMPMDYYYSTRIYRVIAFDGKDTFHEFIVLTPQDILLQCDGEFKDRFLAICQVLRSNEELENGNYMEYLKGAPVKCIDKYGPKYKIIEEIEGCQLFSIESAQMNKVYKMIGRPTKIGRRPEEPPLIRIRELKLAA